MRRSCRASVVAARRACAAAVLACLFLPAYARADEADIAAAKALFDEARRLTAEGRYAEACPKFAESQRLDRGLGTEFYWADCLEHIGQLASAWVHYGAVVHAARRSGQRDREEYARRRADALEPRLPRLVIHVPADARAAGLFVQRDGASVGEAQWGVGIPVDPGGHTVAASAHGKTTWTRRVTAEEGRTVTIAVPSLETAAARDRPGGVASERRGSVQRTAGFAVGGVGILGLGIGAVAGAVAIAKNDASLEDGRCDAAGYCDAEGTSLRQASFDAATVSTAGFIGGAASLAVGAVLVLTAPSQADAHFGAATLAFGPGRALVTMPW